MKNTGDGRRVAKVEMEVQRIVAQYLLGQMKGIIPGLVTVSRVKMPADLRSAKVYVSILNPQGEISEIIGVLQEKASDIQDEINAKLRMRYCPKITFFEDTSTQKALKVEGLLREIQVEREARAKESKGEE